jgi:hypothetical protein
MADDKAGRENQAQHAERRQREREVEMALERGDEPEPPLPTADADALTDDLETLSFPATGDEIVAALGDREIEVMDPDGAEPTDTARVADLIAPAEVEAFDSPASIRTRVRYPGVASAMKRIVEAAGPFQTETLRGSQRDAYEKTLRALADVDALDDDAVVREIVDWIVERVETDQSFPGSRAIRRQAATVCRAHGYEISNNDWLGV